MVTRRSSCTEATSQKRPLRCRHARKIRNGDWSPSPRHRVTRKRLHTKNPHAESLPHAGSRENQRLMGDFGTFGKELPRHPWRETFKGAFLHVLELLSKGLSTTIAGQFGGTFCRLLGQLPGSAASGGLLPPGSAASSGLLLPVGFRLQWVFTSRRHRFQQTFVSSGLAFRGGSLSSWLSYAQLPFRKMGTSRPS